MERRVTGLSKAGHHDASSVIEQVEIGSKKISWRYVVMN